jgi:hypothetical protein
MSLHPAPDDDGDWIAALRGQPPAGAAPRTLDEAARIRAALRRQPAAEGDPEAGLDALLFRLRREDLLDLRTKAPPRRSWYALAAGLAVAAIALPLAIGLLRDTPEPPEHLITRGGIVPPQRIAGRRAASPCRRTRRRPARRRRRASSSTRKRVRCASPSRFPRIAVPPAPTFWPDTA